MKSQGVNIKCYQNNAPVWVVGVYRVSAPPISASQPTCLSHCCLSRLTDVNGLCGSPWLSLGFFMAGGLRDENSAEVQKEKSYKRFKPPSVSRGR